MTPTPGGARRPGRSGRSGRSGRPGRRLVALAAAGAMLLTACSGQLPTSSEPQQGLPVSVQAQREIERFLTPPQPDASPADIVRGFLRANVGFADDEDVARSFLTEDVASQWVPTSNVLVHTGTPQVEVSSDGRQAQVSVEIVGRIDEQGRLAEQRPGRTTQSFELARVDGQWRISGFPDGFGVWLTREDLLSSFRPTTLYYLSTHGQHFVPEIRWLARSEGMPTAITRAVLAPVPDYLAGAVRTGAGEDIRLAAPSVTVDPDSGVATVPLQGTGLVEGSEVALALQSQLSHALLALGGISAVDVQVAGQSLPAPGEGGPVTSSTELPYQEPVRETNLALLRVGEQFFPIDPTSYNLRNLPDDDTRDLPLPRLGLAWTGVVATADLQDFAAVSTDGTSLWRWQAGESKTNAGIGDALTAPAVDPQGAFWVGGVHRSSGAPRIWLLEREHVGALAEPLEAPWLRERDRLHGLSISPDGTRVAIVLGDVARERQRLLIAGILRDEDGTARGITSPIGVAGALAEVTSARWGSASEIFLVGQREDDVRSRAFTLRLGEWLQPLGTRDGLEVVELVAVPRTDGPEPIARSADGRFHTTEGTQGWWDARNGDELVIPGG